jgi:phosphohistidine phosphatase SixA
VSPTAFHRFRIALLLFACMGAASVARGQELVLLTRHAERVDDSSDSALSAKGETRAARLADMLKDAGITRIYTTELRRTVQTAAPLAATLHLTPAIIPARDHKALVAKIHAAGPHDRLLIVGHANTIPEILHELGVSEAISIGESDYDNLFAVAPRAGGAPLFVRLRY